MNKLIYSSVLFFAWVLVGCNQVVIEEKANKQVVEEGFWRASLTTNQNYEIPFEVFLENNANSWKGFVQNGPEKINFFSVVQDGDSLEMTMPIYLSKLKVKLAGDTMLGRFYKPDEDYQMPLLLVKGAPRFKLVREPLRDISGKWACKISLDKNPYPAIGEFEQNDFVVNGTFITEAGDKRFLTGILSGNMLKLSTFDGAVAYKFMARLTDSLMMGYYHSGLAHKVRWKGSRNDDFKLKSYRAITRLKTGEKNFKFSARNLNGVAVDWRQPQFIGKPMIIQITGTWCPNCKDESLLFEELYQKYNPKGLEVFALAFEKTDDFDKELPKIKAFQNDLNISYPIFFAGRANTAEVLRVLSSLDNFKAYPTAIFVNRAGEVVEIHTGFTGPGTSLYPELVEHTENLVKSLVNG